MTAPSRIPLCWSHETAVATISTEAVTTSPEVFFATHVPLRIRRHHPDVRDSEDAQQVTEDEVQKDFLDRSSPTGALLMPVLGESGTGKSHLVRWIHERTKSDESRAVVYVPKANTSLRALIRILVDRDDIDSPQLSKLRDKVDDFAANVDEQTLQRRLILALAEVVRNADPGTNPHRGALIRRGKLADMLLDVHVGNHLMRAGSFIPRMAASLLKDRGDGETDRPTEFQVSDLPEITTIASASVEVRPTLQQIAGSPQMEAAAAGLLTEAISLAVQMVFGMGNGQLQEAMLTIRKEYMHQGKEIVLLVEDFAVIQGVQSDLLDALIEPAFRDGKQVLAQVRTLMAVTAGYYYERLPETIRTRVESTTPYIYDLDVAFDTSDQGRADTIEFVGRYLNAARVGAQELERSGVAHGQAVPNKCDDCPFMQPCHAAFGASAGGFGIFPLNWPALRRAIHARPTPGTSSAFNPRIVIGEVVVPVLAEADKISAGEFPDGSFKEMFRLVDAERALRSEVEVAINENDATNAARRTVLLEYWGDAPDHLVNLDPTIHATFQVPQLNLADTYIPLTGVGERSGGGSRGGTSDEGGGGTSGEGGSRRNIPAAVAKALVEIDDWAAGRQPLPQNTAGKIRRVVAQAVLNRTQWNDPLTAEPLEDLKKRAWPVKSTVVSIEDADAENLPGTKDAPIRFSRSAANAVFFKGLIAADEDLPGANAANKTIRRLARIAENYAPVAQAAVARTRSADDGTLVAWFTAAMLGAALCGRSWPGMSEDELVNAVFDDGADWELRDAKLRPAAWGKVANEHLKARPEIVAELRKFVGIQRGTQGSPRMIDAARVLPLIRRAAKIWEWQPPNPMPPKLREAVTSGGLPQIAQLAGLHVSNLREVNATLARLLPEGIKLSDTLDAVENAFEQAQNVGLGPTSITDPAEFRRRLNELRAFDSQSVNRLRKDLEAIDAAGDTAARTLAELSTAAIDRGPDLPAILDFLTVCDEWLAARLDEPSRATSAGDAAAQKVQDMITRWRKVVGGNEQ